MPDTVGSCALRIVTKEDIELNIKWKKDGSGVKRTHSNKIAGVSDNVYALRTKDEISSVIKVLNNEIEDALKNENKKVRLKNSYRNKLLWVVGMNVGLRVSDLRLLKWDFFFRDNNGSLEWNEYYTICPQKTKNKHKFVTLYFNNTIHKVVEEYLEKYPISVNNLQDYIFTSSSGNYLSDHKIWEICVDTAKKAGIKQNIGTHSLRKTWAFWAWRNAEDKNKALIVLSNCFNHSSPSITMCYIGIMDEEKQEMYMNNEIGLDCI